MPPKRMLQEILGKSTSSSSQAKRPRIKPAAKPVATPAIVENLIVAEEDYDLHIVDRTHYPAVLSNTRVAEYLSGARPNPLRALQSTLLASILQPPPAAAVIHWFRTDLRTVDNTALAEASAFAAAHGRPLLALYVHCPQQLAAHRASPARTAFVLANLAALRAALDTLNIPLWIETVDARADVPARVLALAKTWRADHVWANIEYEVDELRRDAALVRLAGAAGVDFRVMHDTCVVPPGELAAKSSGNAFAVYSPFYKAFLVKLAAEPGLLALQPGPVANGPAARAAFKELFGCEVPPPPEGLRLTPEEEEVQRTLFPPGTEEAHDRLERFLSEKGRDYNVDRNFPGKPGTAMVSAYLAVGVLSARTAVVRAQQRNGGKLKGGNEGLDVWISEVAWRDFYRHILVAHPHICMHKPFKPAFASITWVSGAEADSRFALWTAGRTGFPIVDAAMRHLAAQKFMPNRLRMVVASFLAKDLHVDWRRGERYFMEQLVDGDFASNSGGWGFASGAGVDPQPYFRVFNPTSQGERFDVDGDYVRTWVPELKNVKGKAVHSPSAETRRRTGYPDMCVVHDVQRKRAIEMYKEGVERGKSVV